MQQRRTRYRRRSTRNRNQDGAYFIDRNGKYFEPLLDFLRTGELIIPEGMSQRSVVLEANFYGIELPPLESGSGLKLVDDRTLNRWAIEALGDTGQRLLEEIIRQFEARAKAGNRVKTGSIVADNKATLTEKIIQSSSETSYPLMNLEAIYAAEDTVVDTAFFKLLGNPYRQKVLVDYARRFNLTLHIEPVVIMYTGIRTPKEFELLVGYTIANDQLHNVP